MKDLNLNSNLEQAIMDLASYEKTLGDFFFVQVTTIDNRVSLDRKLIKYVTISKNSGVQLHYYSQFDSAFLMLEDINSGTLTIDKLQTDGKVILDFVKKNSRFTNGNVKKPTYIKLQNPINCQDCDNTEGAEYNVYEPRTDRFIDVMSLCPSCKDYYKEEGYGVSLNYKKSAEKKKVDSSDKKESLGKYTAKIETKEDKIKKDVLDYFIKNGVSVDVRLYKRSNISELENAKKAFFEIDFTNYDSINCSSVSINSKVFVIESEGRSINSRQFKAIDIYYLDNASDKEVVDFVIEKTMLF